MKYKNLHPWDLSPKEAMDVQTKLASQVITNDQFSEIKTIAGADIALEDDTGYAGVIVYHYPELIEIERVYATAEIKFPYIPGLLAFREAPVLLKAFEGLSTEPDLVIFDGQGIAHPRRLGIASHMGLVLDRPTIGCAKSRLFGKYEEPGEKAGEWAPLTITPSLKTLSPMGRGVIGAVLRTRDNVRPVFVSIGHCVSLETAIKIIVQCLDGVRIPKPTREADHFVERAKKGIYSAGLVQQALF